MHIIAPFVMPSVDLVHRLHLIPTRICSDRNEETIAFLQNQIWRKRTKDNSQIAVPPHDIALPCAPILEEEDALTDSSPLPATIENCIPTLFTSTFTGAVRTRAPTKRPLVQLQTREQIFEAEDPVLVRIGGEWLPAKVAPNQSEFTSGKVWVRRSGRSKRDAVSWYLMRPADPQRRQPNDQRWSKKGRWQLLVCCLDKCYKDSKGRGGSSSDSSLSPFRTMQVGQTEDRRQCLSVYDQVIDCLSSEIQPM